MRESVIYQEILQVRYSGFQIGKSRGFGGVAPKKGRQGGLGGYPLEPLPCGTPSPRQ